MMQLSLSMLIIKLMQFLLKLSQTKCFEQLLVFHPYSILF